MATELNITQCPIGCNSSLVDTDIFVGGRPIRECSVCGHLVGTSDEETHAAANLTWDTDEGTWPDERSMRRLERRRLRTIRTAARIISRPVTAMRLLDVGCSNGALLDIAIRHGMQAEGVEPAQSAARDGLRRGFNIHVGLVEALPIPHESFDLITNFEVIEHISDPLPLLKACHDLLRPGGVLVIGTGNVDSFTFSAIGTKWDFMYPHTGHINFYSTSSLAQLTSSNGFRVAKVLTSAVSLSSREQTHPLKYRILKLAGQVLEYPARLAGKGHQVELFAVKI